MNDTRRSVILGLGAMALSPLLAQQGDYPQKTIRMVVPWGAGGATDTMARLVAHEMEKEFGQSVIVDNMPGGGGVIGTANVARAKPDGYTLIFLTNGHTMNAAFKDKLPYDSVAAFTPLAMLASTPNLLVVPANSPFRTVDDYIAAARANPGTISCSVSGGTSTHIGGAQFAKLTGTRYIFVPFNSTAQGMQSLLSGTSMSSWSAVSASMPFVKAGKMRALAIATPERSPLAPDVPTLAELGVKGMHSHSWFAVMAPAGLPEPIANKLARFLEATLNRSDITRKLFDLGATPLVVTQAKFAGVIREEIETYTTMAREKAIQFD